MENKNPQSVVYPQGTVVQPTASALGVTLEPADDTNSLSQMDPTALSQPPPAPQPPKRPNLLVRLAKRTDVVLAVLIVLGMIGVIFATSSKNPRSANNSKNAAAKYDTQEIPLESFEANTQGVDFGVSSVTVNGQLKLNSGLVISPTQQPSSSTAGQLYYDQTTNELAYFNGTEYVSLSGDLVTGVGISNINGQLSNTGVLSVQGQTGDVTFTSGDGIEIDGTTILNSGVLSIGDATGSITLGTGLNVSGNILSNTGVISVGGATGSISLGAGLSISSGTLVNSGLISAASGSSNITVSNDGSGNITISSSAGSGTVTGSGTAGKLAKFSGAQSIADSLVSESGSTVTVTGGLSVTSALSLGTALTVANGGTGATSLTANGVLVGNGTSAITSVTAAGAGQCFQSTAGAPAFSACPGGSGVTSLEGLTGALTIDNATGTGTTITIDDATTAAKGIASFNSTNFSVTAGAVNTIQNINTGASPTFVGLTLTGDLAVNGGDITSTGALNITPSGALVVGATGQTALLQGSTTTITSTGAGNDITLNSADTIELVDNTNITGNLDVLGTLTSGTGDAFQVSSAGAVTAVGVNAGAGLLQGALGLTISGAAVSLNHDSNFATNINTGTSTGTITLGGGTAPLVINSTNFDVSSAGALSGITTIATSSTINSQTISSTANFTGTLTVQGATSTIGTTAVQGSLVLHDGNGETASLRVGNALAANTIIAIPTAVSVSDTICLLTLANCVGTGGGVSGNGTNNTITKFTSTGSTVGDSTITDNGTNVITSVDLIVQGGDATVGTTAQQGSLILHDGNGQTATIRVGNALAANTVIAIPTAVGVSDTVCLLTLANCTGSGSSNTLQAAYEAGNTITTSGSRDIALTLDNNSNLTVASAAGTTGSTTFSLTDGSNATPATQLVLIRNNDTNQALAAGLKVTSAAGGITTALDVSGSNITTGLALGGSAITGTNFSVTAAGAVTAVGVNAGAGLIQGTLGLTISGAVASLNNDSNFATNINTGTSTGTVTIGGGTAPLVINSTNFDVTSAGAVSGVTTLSTSGIITPGAVGAADTSTALCRNAANQIATCIGTGAGAAFVQGGNDFNATAVLGTNDTDALELETNNTTRLTIGAAGGISVAANNNLSLASGTGTFGQTYTGTTTDAHTITANSLTTATALKVTSSNNSAADTAWSATQLNITNAQGTTAVSTGTISGLDLQFTQNTSIAGNTETVATFAVKQNDSSSTDATVASLLNLANNDTATGNQITVTDGLKITGSNVTNGLNLSGTFGTNLITSTNFSVTQAGLVTGVGVNSGTGLIQGTGGLTISGAAVSLNASSNFATSINTGTSTGTVTIGGGGGDLVINSTAFDVTSAGAVSGVTTLATSGIITPGAVGAADTSTALCRNAANQIATCIGTGSGAAFVQGGNDFNATAVLGTNDTDALELETNNTTRLTIGAAGGVSVAANNNFSLASGTGTFGQIYTGTTTDAHTITANSLTTASAFKVTSSNNSAADTAWSATQLNVTNAQGTTAVSTGSIYGFDLQFTQNPSIAGNTESAANFAIKQNDSSATDATVTSIINVANNDTATGNQITATNGLLITGTNITNGLNLSGTFGTSLITSTNFSVTQAGIIATAALGTADSVTYLCRNASNQIASCQTGATGSAFIQGGNSFTATATLGTNDGFDLAIERGGTTQLTVGSGNVTFASNVDLSLQGATAYISNPQAQTASESFGLNAAVSGANALVVGNGATSSAGGVALGQGAVSVDDGVSIGRIAGVTSGALGGPVSIGQGANAASYGVAIGSGSATSGNAGTAVGQSAETTGQLGTAIGQNATANSVSVALGAEATAGGNNQIAIGYSAATTADNQLVIGGTTADESYISNAFIGSGVVDVTPKNVVLQGTGGSGSDVAGASFTLAGGKSTGNANGGGINFQISAPGSSGSSLNTLATVASLSGANGSALFKNAANSATAFQVQDAAAAGLLTVDTAARGASGGNLVKIGNSTGTNGDTTILQLDGTTADPTSNLAALDGGLFYNSATDKVSLIENGIIKIICNTTDLGCGTGTITLQNAYTNGNTISATDEEGDVSITLTEDATDPNFLVDLQCDTCSASGGRFAVQDDGADVFTVSPAAGGITIGSDTLNTPVTVNSGTGTIAIGTGAQARTINLGTGAAVVQTISIGGTGANVIAIGNTQTAGSIALGAAMTGGTITIGGTGLQTGAITFGGGTGAQTVNLGTGDTGVKTVNLGTGTAANVISIGTGQTGGSIALGTAMTTGTISIGGTGAQTGTISLGIGTGVQAINLATGGTGAKAATLGGVDSTSVTTIQGGTGTAAGDINIGDQTTASKILDIGSVTNSGTGTVRIATAAAAQTVTVGSTGTGSSLTLNGGSGNTVLNATAGTVTIQTTTSGAINIKPVSADGTNIVLGTSGDDLGTLLVLDEKTGASDPTGVAGGMYYNSNRKSFRCYEDGLWYNCRESSKSSFRVSTEIISQADEAPFTTFTEPSGTNTYQAAIINHPGGYMRHETDASTTGGAGIGVNSSENWIVFGSGDTWRYDTMVRIPTLSTAAEAFTVRIGFHDGNVFADPSNGCMFKQTDATTGSNGGRWQGYCADAGSAVCDTGVTPILNQWVRLTIVVNAAGNSADFKINGASTCQVTSQIPITAASPTGASTTIRKSAGSTERTLHTDYIEVSADLTRPVP